MQVDQIHAAQDTASDREQMAWIIVAFTTVGMLLFGYLWWGKKPIEKIIEKEVPVEVVKTVEVVKPYDNPAHLELVSKLREELATVNGFVKQIDSAPFIADGDTLRQLGPVSVHFFISEKLKGVVQESVLKQNFELRLRSFGVVVNDTAPVWVTIEIDGLWLDEKITFSYSYRVKVLERVLVIRSDFFAHHNAPIWSHGGNAYAGTSVLKNSIIESVAGLADAFSNKYLAGNPKR